MADNQEYLRMRTSKIADRIRTYQQPYLPWVDDFLEALPVQVRKSGWEIQSFAYLGAMYQVFRAIQTVAPAVYRAELKVVDADILRHMVPITRHACDEAFAMEVLSMEKAALDGRMQGHFLGNDVRRAASLLEILKTVR